MRRASGCGGLAAQAAAATGVTAATSSQASAKWGEVYKVHDTPWFVRFVTPKRFMIPLRGFFNEASALPCVWNIAKKKHLNEWKPDRFD